MITSTTTTTTTTTISTHDHLFMSLTGTSNNQSTEVNCDKIINDLVKIIKNHENWEDLLSFKIFDWAQKSLEHVKYIDRENPGNILGVIQSDVNELFNEVLISTLLTPLHAPILMGDFTWEPDELTQYYETYKYCPKSPFYEKELDLSSKKTHKFAIEMLKWAECLPIKRTEEPSYQLVSIHNDYSSEAIVPICSTVNHIDIEKANNQLSIYLKCEEIARGQLNMYKIAQPFKEATKELQILAAKVHEHLQIAVDAAKLHAEEEKEKTLQQLQEIKDSHAKTVEDLKSLIENNKNKITETSEKFTDTEQLCETDKARIDELNEELKRQLRQIKKLKKKADKSACTIC